MSTNTLGINIQLNGAAAAAAGLNGVGDAARNAGSSASGGFADASSAAGGLTTAVKAIGSAFAGLALVDFAKQASRALSEAQQAADKLRNSLTYSSGSAAGAAKEMQYLREISANLGLDFNSAAAAYAKFAASTKGSGITIAETKSVFEGISQAAARLGLSASEVEGMLLAVSQMASKGTVASEELRGQLAERLPGAFGIAAKAMGVTTAELGKLLESGKVFSADFLPKFGRALKEEFSGAVNSLTQEINRMSSSWDIWKQTFANSDGWSMRVLSDGINESSAAMRSLGKDAGVTYKALAAVGFALLGMTNFGKFDTQGIQKVTIEKLSAVRNEREALQAKGMNYLDLGKLDILKQQEAELRSKIEELSVRRGKEAGFQDPDLKGAFEVEKARRAQGLKGYLDDLSNAPKSVKVAAAVEVENKAFQKAVSGFAETDKSYLAALKAHQERLAEIQKGPKGSAGSAAKDPLDGLLENYQRDAVAAAAGLSSSTVKEIENLGALLNVGKVDAKEYNRLLDTVLNKDSVLKSEQAGLDKSKLAQAAFGQSIDHLQDAYDRQNAIYSEKKMTAAERELESALRKVSEAASSARETLSQKASSLEGDDVRALEAYRQAITRVNEAEVDQMDKVIALQAEQERLNSLWETGAQRALNKYAEASTTVAQDVENAFSKGFQGMEDALMTFVSTGKLSFADLAKSIIADLARIELKAQLRTLLPSSGDAGGLLGKAGSWLGNLFGGSSGITGGTVAGVMVNGIAGGPLSGAGLHSGGIAGIEATFMRNVSPDLFARAPRFHTGGIAGNEVPAILRKGEGVFTPAQMQALGKGGMAGAVTINVHLNGPSDNAAEVRRSAGQGARAAWNALQGSRRYV